MWIDRHIEASLRRAARTRPVVVLTGARQTGKTSTLRRLFPDHGFVSLDLPTEAEQAERETRDRGYPAGNSGVGRTLRGERCGCVKVLPNEVARRPSRSQRAQRIV